jgi:hypothetical protein
MTYRPKHPVPVREFLAGQGRFAYLSDAQIETIQAHGDARWEQIAGKAEINSNRSES